MTNQMCQFRDSRPTSLYGAICLCIGWWSVHVPNTAQRYCLVLGGECRSASAAPLVHPCQYTGLYKAKIIVFDPMKYKSPNVPLQDELLTWTSQLRTGQPSIFATQVRDIVYCIKCTTKLINTAACLVRAPLDFCTSWGQTQWFLLF